jgi:CheY-like chemotaxis protein/anti-sigma regulatory factor (Ser/Thr protein kinase)
MMTGARHLTAIVGDLLDLSSFEAGGLRLTLGPVPLTDAITEAKSLIWPSTVTATVGIRLKPGIDDLYVKADHHRLQQVLLNLLSNAVKYNRRGGNVVVNATREGGRVRIEVADTGIGIPSEAIERLAQPFERLDAARNGIPGTGLGLAVARGLVEAMGGTLGLSSQEGVGTTVWFDLPAAVGEEPTRSPRPTISSPPADGSSPERISVLYIEDNRPLARLTEKIFALAPDLRLQTAGDAALGLAMARELAPDLIMLDLHLPDMSGEQVLAALLADPRTAAIPVLIVTAEASPLQVRELNAAGARGYITKPFDVDELLASVRAHAGARARQGNHDQPVVRGVGQSRSPSANVSEIGPERAESR